MFLRTGFNTRSLPWTSNLDDLPSDLETLIIVQFSSVQLLSCVRHFVTPWIAAHQASLSITNSRSSPKLMSIESVMPSSHLILCCPLILLPPIPPSIRVFSNESVLYIRWPKYWSFSFNISLSNEHSGLISLGWTGWISLQFRGLSRVFSNTTVQKYQFSGAQLSSQSNSHSTIVLFCLYFWIFTICILENFFHFSLFFIKSLYEVGPIHLV